MTSKERTEGTAPPSPFSCEVQENADITLLVCEGELDIAATEQIADCAEKALECGAPIEIDLEAVSFLDSMGLRSLLALFNRSTGERPRIIAASEPVRRVMELTGTSALFGL
jgi:anti-anti-sigma factor